MIGFPRRGGTVAIISALATASSVLQPHEASALVVDVPGFGIYDIITVQEQYAQLTTEQQIQLQNQEWFGDQANANIFGQAWLTAAQNSSLNANAKFVFSVSSTTPPESSVASINCNSTSNCASAVNATNTPLNFAYATPVPGPISILGAASAFAYSRKLRKRIKFSKQPVSNA
ncbi:hypothetical protein I1E95_11845 [Synechococcus sp. CBW1107]|uniref:hypothetical protein n=1 Tax=Synechococcus sp. CBW1107 TaxID=2789857 RepID=UPI0018CFA1F8|nr:hypothetical protein [Synechococcus sp. CBW1107]QPN55841.1 hypothetical protein I1E95_11845 [Synechococcus sp. CBW1107]